MLHFRPHRSTTHACGLLLPTEWRGLSVGLHFHMSESCENGWTDRDNFWIEYLCGPREPCRWGQHRPMGRGNFEGKGWPIVNYGDAVTRELCKKAKSIDLPFGCGLGWAWRKHKFNRIRQVEPMRPPFMGGHIGPPEEHDFTVRLRRRCGFMSNYFDHLFSFGNLLAKCPKNIWWQSEILWVP